MFQSKKREYQAKRKHKTNDHELFPPLRVKLDYTEAIRLIVSYLSKQHQEQDIRIRSPFAPGCCFLVMLSRSVNPASRVASTGE